MDVGCFVVVSGLDPAAKVAINVGQFDFVYPQVDATSWTDVAAVRTFEACKVQFVIDSCHQ